MVASGRYHQCVRSLPPVRPVIRYRAGSSFFPVSFSDSWGSPYLIKAPAISFDLIHHRHRRAPIIPSRHITLAGFATHAPPATSRAAEPRTPQPALRSPHHRACPRPRASTSSTRMPPFQRRQGLALTCTVLLPSSGLRRCGPKPTLCHPALVRPCSCPCILIATCP